MSKFVWEAKASANAEYQKMPTPASYDIEWEDFDADTYRNINTGDMKDKVVSSKWTKAKFVYNYQEESEVEDLCQMINNNPIYVRHKNPMYRGGIAEMQMRCSKGSISMQKNLEDGAEWNRLSFNLVQKKKASGQK